MNYKVSGRGETVLNKGRYDGARYPSTNIMSRWTESGTAAPEGGVVCRHFAVVSRVPGLGAQVTLCCGSSRVILAC